MNMAQNPTLLIYILEASGLNPAYDILTVNTTDISYINQSDSTVYIGFIY
jgi:hypothetical protein